MSNSHKKMNVVVGETEWGKKWVKVEFLYSRKWIPSFEDLHRIIQGISYCEDIKYPGGEGRDMVARFLKDAVYEQEYLVLETKYKLPRRS